MSDEPGGCCEEDAGEGDNVGWKWSLLGRTRLKVAGLRAIPLGGREELVSGASSVMDSLKPQRQLIAFFYFPLQEMRKFLSPRPTQPLPVWIS